VCGLESNRKGPLTCYGQVDCIAKLLLAESRKGCSCCDELNGRLPQPEPSPAYKRQKGNEPAVNAALVPGISAAREPYSNKFGGMMR
jgi:hypothetical protein